MFFWEKNLNCSRDFLSMCGDLIILSSAERFVIVPARNDSILNGSVRVGIL